MRIGDGYGEMLLAAPDEGDGEVLEIVERGDGFIMASRFGPGAYLAPYRKWPPRQRRAMRLHARTGVGRGSRSRPRRALSAGEGARRRRH